MKKILIGLLLVSTLALITTCEMEVAEEVTPVPFMEPYISKQPASISYPADSFTAPTLSVETAGWIAEDGVLTYKWFTFADTAAYLNNQATEIPATASTDTSSTLSPTIANPVAGTKAYYYATVTNTNSNATDKRTGTVTSKVAVISLYDSSAPAIPVITQQTSGAQARFGASFNPLSVRVAPVTGELSFQWYSVELDEASKPIVEGGKLKATAIEGETNSVFLPNTTHTPKLGKYYFYVTITHTENGKSSSEDSIPALIEILPGVRAAIPSITVQPKAGLYFAGDTIAPLTVEAVSTDFGAITYQWYRNTSAVTTGGTVISGQRNATYTPDVSEGQSFYYYAVVTNTNNNVVEEKTATIATRPVNVRRSATAEGIDANAVVTVDTSKKFNYVRGYGGMEVAWANFPETTPADTELQYDPDKLGFNMLRIMLPVSNVNIDMAMEHLVTERRQYYYDNVKIVNKYGGYVAAAPWSPPKEWKSNNSINGGGYLRPEYYDQYAAYLRSFAQHMYNRGAPIYVISIQNEPNYVAGYDGCEWEPEQARDFFLKVGSFTQGVKGYGGGKETPRVLTMNGESANNVDYNFPAIDNPDSYAVIDVFARHVYGDRRTNTWAQRPFVQQTDGKEVWMTEHNINSANATAYPNDSTWNYMWRFMNDVDLVMRLNNENAFVWWASKRFYSMVGDGQYGTPDGVALPRGWGLSHYSKYTIDTHRVAINVTGTLADGTDINYQTNADGTDSNDNTQVNGATGDMDNVSARITAYVSQDGNEISLVMWTPTLTGGTLGKDMGTIEIKMPAGFLIGGAVGIQSYAESAQRNVFHAPYDVEIAANRQSAYVTLPGSRFISVKFTKQ